MGYIMPDDNTVVVEKLVKVYPGGLRAVAGIDFTVARGEFFGFLGSNGAGKTTTMKILATLLRASSGRVMVAGYNVSSHHTAVRRSIGFAMQEVGLDDLATGWDFMVLQGLLYGLPWKEVRRRAAELLELVGLVSVAKRKIGTYSGGMRRRIDLAAALIHSPPVLFLDEPTLGLDPQSRLAIWEYLTELNKQGVTVFLTTQMMEEADRLCQRIAIIDCGQIVAGGSPQGLKAEMGGDVVQVALDSGGQGMDSATTEKAAVLARGCSYVEAVGIGGSRLSIKVRDGSAAAPDLLRLLQEHGIFVRGLSVSSSTLDDVFLKYTGQKIRAEEGEGNEVAQAIRPFLELRRQ